ncbi:MAG: hypothetical protein ALAOOOJD_02927 [bacterium]|nr:hypothetical protein [bacterium]
MGVAAQRVTFNAGLHVAQPDAAVFTRDSQKLAVGAESNIVDVT